MRDKPLPKSKREKKKEKEKCYPVALGIYLIVCEGEKTEPNYFKSYQNALEELKNEARQIRIIRNGEDIIVKTSTIGDKFEIKGTGYNTLSLVDVALNMKNKAFQDYEAVWCVFDKDSFKDEQFNNAIFKAEQHGILVAYSNEAFELWYLLHFDYHDTPIKRQDYRAKLTEKLGETYQKNSLTMYQNLEDKQEQAIKNAKRLLGKYGDCKKYATHNPSTTVHLLVEALNKYLEAFESNLVK